MAETGIQWGGWSGRLRLGVNVRWEDIGPYTETSHVWADFYYGTNGWGYDTDNTLSFGGSLGGAWAYHLYSPYASSVTTLIGTYDMGVQGTSYGGGPSWNLSAWTSPAYNGDAPSVTYGFTLPARGASRPSAPAAPSIFNITSSSAYVWWPAPADNGAGIDAYQVQIAYDPGFTNLFVQSQVYGATTFYGLAAATPYYARVVAHNPIDWSDWGPGTLFVTTPTFPSAPSTPDVWAVNPDSVTLGWSAPGYNGGSPITGYTVQVSPSSGFETATTVYPGNVTSCTVTGLQPGAHYYARVSASNGAAGAGPWSGIRQFDTLSGAKVKVNGAWVTAKVYVKVNGTWVQAKVYKKVNGAWLI